MKPEPANSVGRIINKGSSCETRTSYISQKVQVKFIMTMNQ